MADKQPFTIVYNKHGHFGVELFGKKFKDTNTREFVGYEQVFAFEHKEEKYAAFSPFWDGTIAPGVYKIEEQDSVERDDSSIT